MALQPARFRKALDGSLALSIAAAVLLFFAGWMGWSLVGLICVLGVVLCMALCEVRRTDLERQEAIRMWYKW